MIFKAATFLWFVFLGWIAIGGYCTGAKTEISPLQNVPFPPLIDCFDWEKARQERLLLLKAYTSEQMLKKSQQQSLMVSCHRACHQQNLETVNLWGNVCLRYPYLLIEAPQIYYDRKKDQGHCPEGFVLQDARGVYMTCGEGFFSKAFHHFSLKQLTLNAGFSLPERLTAAQVSRDVSEEICLDYISYTPCQTCQDQLDPLWSLHADRMIYNEQTKFVTFKNAQFKMLGNTLVKIPYFYMPTQRCSGVLSPYVDFSQELGGYLGVPYYMVLNPHKDLTLTPFIMTRGGAMLSWEYRQRYLKGSLAWKGALNALWSAEEKRDLKNAFSLENGQDKRKKPSGNQALRGYTMVDGRYDLSSHWSISSYEWWVGDKTFLSSRPFFGQSGAAYLESKSALQGFYDKDFFHIKGIRYEGFQENDRLLDMPYIYPEITHIHESFLGPFRLKAFSRSLSLDHQERTHLRKLMTDATLTYPWRSSWGQDFYVFLRSQECFSDSKSPPLLSSKSIRRQKKGVWRPQAGLGGEWPFFLGSSLVEIKPSFQMLFAPEKEKCFYIFSAHNQEEDGFNQDSQGVFFDAYHFFKKNRYSGTDMWDGGSRGNYGLSCHLFNVEGAALSLHWAQSYALGSPANHLQDYGIRKGFSDQVFGLDTTTPWGFLGYLTQWNVLTNNLEKHQALWSLGSPLFKVSGSYIFNQRSKKFLLHPFYHQLFLDFSSQFTNHWRGRVFFSRNLKGPQVKAQDLTKGIGFFYKNECLSWGATLQHTSFRRREVKPGFSVEVYFLMRNIGGIQPKEIRFERFHSETIEEESDSF